MLKSLAIIFLLGLIFGGFLNMIKLPHILGMLIVGILIGPNLFNLLDEKILNISQDLRQLALIIILTRAGLALNFEDLRQVGRPAILMCFLPAVIEILAFMIFAPMFFDLTLVEAGIMGSVIAAVSPAVIVPKMLKLMAKRYGDDKKIPQLIMAGASVDDVFVIVIFTSFVALEKTGGFSPISLVRIPISIVLGIIFGIILGFLIANLFSKFKIDTNKQVLILLSVSFLLQVVEKEFPIIPFSALLCVMAMGSSIKRQDDEMAKALSKKYFGLWSGAEIFLFVLVGATVDLRYALSAGKIAIVMIFIALLFRVFGVYLCLIRSKLNLKERIFTMFAYTPKATVQAAIGSVPLSMGFKCGNIVLTMAVLSILITAPIGAKAIDFLYTRTLNKS